MKRYLVKASGILGHLRYVSDEAEELQIMSTNETLTIARLYEYLHGLGFQRLPGKERKNLVRACVDCKKHNSRAWLHCMNLPRKVALKAKHQWAEEIYFSRPRRKSRAVIGWLCSKLNHYVRVFTSLYRFMPSTAEECARYSNISLNEAILDMLFKCKEVEEFMPDGERRAKVFTLGILQMWFKRVYGESERIPKFTTTSGSKSGSSVSQRYELSRHYLMIFEEEIKQRERELGALTYMEDYQTKAILELKNPMVITDAAHAEFNDSVIIYVDDEKRFLPKSSLKALRPLLKTQPYPSYDGPTVIYEGELYYISDAASFNQLFRVHSSKRGSCGICLDRKSTIGCGNGCTWCSCWDCFHEWFSKELECPMCTRKYIPLKYRE